MCTLSTYTYIRGRSNPRLPAARWAGPRSQGEGIIYYYYYYYYHYYYRTHIYIYMVYIVYCILIILCNMGGSRAKGGGRFCLVGSESRVIEVWATENSFVRNRSSVVA